MSTADMALAAVLVGPEAIELRELPKPRVAPDGDDGVLAIEASGVCGSDIAPYLGTGMTIRRTVPYNLPLILGHEIVGTIEQAGRGALHRWGLAEGDRVILERWIPCGRCEDCYAGNYRMCVPRIEGEPRFYGGSSLNLAPSLWGGFASHLYLHPSAMIYRLPESVATHHAPLYTPISNNLSWLGEVGGVGVGSTVVILGPGQEGLVAVMVAAALGASLIVVVGLDRDARRLQIAKDLGAHLTVSTESDAVVDVVNQATDGRMADVVLDVTSAPDLTPIQLALSLVGRSGRIVAAAPHPVRDMEFDMSVLLSRLASIHAVSGRSRASVFAAIRLMASGRLPLDKLPSATFPLERTQAAIEAVIAGGDAVHAVIEPNLQLH